MTANMKTIVILISSVLLVSYVAAQGDFGNRREFFVNCLDEFGISPANIRNVFQAETDEARRTKNCFVACILEATGTLQDTKFDKASLCDEMRARLPEDLAESACEHSDRCVDEGDGIDDKCEVVERFHDCFYGYLPVELQEHREALSPYRLRPLRRHMH